MLIRLTQVTGSFTQKNKKGDYLMQCLNCNKEIESKESIEEQLELVKAFRSAFLGPVQSCSHIHSTECHDAS
jgi:hypothetical protein